MDIELINIIIPCIASLLTGGGLSWIFTIRYTRKQEEANATKTSQEIYQALITDLNSDRGRLIEEKDQLRGELTETQRQVKRLDQRSNTLQNQVQLVNRKLNEVLPLTCSAAPTCETKRKLTEQQLWWNSQKAPEVPEVPEDEVINP